MAPEAAQADVDDGVMSRGSKIEGWPRMDIGHGPAIILRRMHRPHWLKRRLEGITATDVAAIFALSEYKTPMQVWAEKTGRAEPDSLDDDYAVQRGNALESLLLRTWCRDNAAEFVKPPALLAHPRYPLIRASLDGMAEVFTSSEPSGPLQGLITGDQLESGPDLVVLEAKSAGWRSREDWWDDERGIPDAYAVQVLTQLAVTGLEAAYVVADVAGELSTVRVERDRGWEQQAVPYLYNWWTRHVGGDTPPPPDPVRDWPLFVRTWLTEAKSSREATKAERLLLTAWAHEKADAKRADEDCKRLRGEVRIAMGTTQTLTVDGIKAVSVDARGTLRPGPALAPTPREEEVLA